MKKYLLFILITTFIFASNPLEKAKKYYQDKNYTKAYQILNKDYLNYLDKLDIQFLYAKSAYKTKHYKEAVAALQRILIYMPENIYARFELAKTYYTLHDYIESKSIFENLLKEDLSKNMQKAIIKYISNINDALINHKKIYFAASISAGLGYTFNINMASSADDFYVPAFGTYFQNISKKKSDAFHQESAFFNFIYKLNSLKHFYLQNRFNFYAKTYLNEKDYNVLIFNYTPVLSYYYKNFIINNELGIGDVFYSNEQYGYYCYYSPEIIYTPLKNLQTHLKFKIQKNNYKDNQNYYFVRLAGGINYKFWIFGISPKAFIQTDRKTTYKAIDNDKNIYYLNNDFSLNFSKTRYILSLSYKNTYFLDKDPLFQAKRKDRLYKIDLKKSSSLFWGINLITSLSFSKNFSNFTPYSYKQFTAEINLKKDFK